MGFAGGSEDKESVCNAETSGALGLIPGWGRSAGEGNGHPLQYPCLENPMDRGAWRATVHGVTESDTTEMTGHTHTLPLNSAVTLPGSHSDVVGGRVPLLPAHSRSAGAPL